MSPWLRRAAEDPNMSPCRWAPELGITGGTTSWGTAVPTERLKMDARQTKWDTIVILPSSQKMFGFTT
jgi:hypothetical protein